MNNGVIIAKRLFALRDFFYTHADQKHAVRFDEIRAFYRNTRLIDGKYDKMICADLHALKEIGKPDKEKSNSSKVIVTSMCFDIALKW